MQGFMGASAEPAAARPPYLGSLSVQSFRAFLLAERRRVIAGAQFLLQKRGDSHGDEENGRSCPATQHARRRFGHRGASDSAGALPGVALGIPEAARPEVFQGQPPAPEANLGCASGRIRAKAAQAGRHALSQAGALHPAAARQELLHGRVQPMGLRPAARHAHRRDLLQRHSDRALLSGRARSDRRGKGFPGSDRLFGHLPGSAPALWRQCPGHLGAGGRVLLVPGDVLRRNHDGHRL